MLIDRLIVISGLTSPIVQSNVAYIDFMSCEGNLLDGSSLNEKLFRSHTWTLEYQLPSDL